MLFPTPEKRGLSRNVCRARSVRLLRLPSCAHIRTHPFLLTRIPLDCCVPEILAAVEVCQRTFGNQISRCPVAGRPEFSSGADHELSSMPALFVSGPGRTAEQSTGSTLPPAVRFCAKLPSSRHESDSAAPCTDGHFRLPMNLSCGSAVAGGSQTAGEGNV